MTDRQYKSKGIQMEVQPMTGQDTLKQAGLKETKPRLMILQCLAESKEHLSADELYKRLKESDQSIVLATVYRVLKQFESAGIVIKHRFSPDVFVYELDDGEHHDHLVCVQCDGVIEFVDELIERHQEVIAQNHGFKITDHCMTIYGLCSACQAKHSH